MPKGPTTLSAKEMPRGELSREGAKAAALCSHLPDKRRQMFCVCALGLAAGFGWLLESRGFALLSSHHCLLSHADKKN